MDKVHVVGGAGTRRYRHRQVQGGTEIMEAGMGHTDSREAKKNGEGARSKPLVPCWLPPLRLLAL